MKKVVVVVLTMVVMSITALAAPVGPGAPEIDPGSAANAIAVLFGAGMILRGRRKQ